MKLTKGHLFIILLLTLIFCCGLGAFGIVEGMENKDNRDEPATPDKDKKHNNNNNNNYDNFTPQSTLNGNGYSNYNPNVDNNSELFKMVKLDDGRVIYATPQNTINGVPGKNIPPGQEDLYILKSQVVPPVCPACPTIINKCDGKKDAPPCPPCGRCPETSFECVKRPTYKPDNPYLPTPVLSDFSSFGM